MFSPPTINNKDLHNHFQKVATDMLGSSRVQAMEPLMGSEDFAFYQEAIPGYFFFLGAKDETNVKLVSVHSPYVIISEDALPYGAALGASLAVRYVLENQPEAPSLNRRNHQEL